VGRGRLAGEGADPVSEDEAFIRAIVASPGVDLPRLVYADYLDERGDPRGTYLRAECEATVSGDVTLLRKLAEGLDPVWVARVSMPPVGACLAHIEFDDYGPGASEEQVAAAERQLGIAFPPEYRAFLLNYNGCWVHCTHAFETPNGEIVHPNEDYGWRLSQLDSVRRFPLRSDDTLQGDYDLPPLTESIEDWLSRFVCVGHDPEWIGTLFLGVAGADVGQVRILDTSIEVEVSIRRNAGQPPFATTFSEFLARLPNGSGSRAPVRRPRATPPTETGIPF
jgi:uncharacterized protein (TIGR02996 family)